MIGRRPAIGIPSNWYDETNIADCRQRTYLTGVRLNHRSNHFGQVETRLATGGLALPRRRDLSLIGASDKRGGNANGSSGSPLFDRGIDPPPSSEDPSQPSGRSLATKPERPLFLPSANGGAAHLSKRYVVGFVSLVVCRAYYDARLVRLREGSGKLAPLV